MSDTTKKLRNKSRFTWWLSIMLTMVPMSVFVTIGFVNGTTQQKVAIGFTAIASIILAVISLMSKMNIKRSIFYVILIGLYVVMKDLYPLLITMGVCTLADDIVVSPLHNRYNTDYHTNKQIDKREKE